MNPVLLQKQLKENASDLQDFCKDLQNWGEEMKRKEESTKSSGNNIEKSSPKTKVRKIVNAHKKEEKKTVEKPSRKVGSTDYAAWDKFDADAECEKVDSDHSEDSELTDEIDEAARDQAIVEKDKGNKFVKNQKWDQAIECYTKAIDFYSYDPIFYANRALCYLKKESFEKAEKDCTLSLKLDNTYVKAYQRRAAAREQLNKFEEAIVDLTKVLELEPKNKESQMCLEKLKKKFGKNIMPPEPQRPVSKFTASRNKSKMNPVPLVPSPTIEETSKIIDTSKPESIWPHEDNIILVNAINKPPHLRSKKPLKRIEIVESDTFKIEGTLKTDGAEAFKKSVVEKHEPLRQMDTKKMEEHTAFPKPNQRVDHVNSDDFKVVEKKLESNLPEISKYTKNISNIDIATNSKTESVKPKICENGLVDAPKTTVQFYTTWKTLKSTNEKYEYLKIIQPKEIPNLFKESLESSVFSNILEVLAKHAVESKDNVFDVLENFTHVKRFSTFTMFMSSTDKNCLWKLFDYVREHEKVGKEDVDELIKLYEL